MGSVLAAVGTALPETLHPDHRHRLHRHARRRTTSASARSSGRRSCSPASPWSSPRVAVVVFYWRGRRPLAVTVNEDVMRRDLSHFLIAYALAMVAGVRARPRAALRARRRPHALLRLLRLRRPCAAEGDLGEDTKPLYFHRHPEMPHTVPHLPADRRRSRRHHRRRRDLRARGRDAQHDARRRAAGASRCSSRRSPPSCRRSSTRVLWIRQRKDTLALGNITGRDGVPEHVPGLDRPRLHDLAAHQRRPGGRRAARSSAGRSSTSRCASGTRSRGGRSAAPAPCTSRTWSTSSCYAD